MKIFHNTFFGLGYPQNGCGNSFSYRRTTPGVQSMYSYAHRTTLQYFRTTFSLGMGYAQLRRTYFLVRSTTLLILRTTMQLLKLYLQSFRTTFSYLMLYAQLHRTHFQLRRTTLRIEGLFSAIKNAYPLLSRNHIKVKFSFVETRLTLNSFGSASAIL